MSVPALTDTQRDRAAWRISSFSTNGGGSCVEVGPLGDGTGRVAVRHSHRPLGTAFLVDAGAWTSFVRSAADGDLLP